MKNQDFDVLMILGKRVSEPKSYVCQKLPEIVAEHPGIFTPLDPSVTWMTIFAHSHDKLMGKEWKEAFFPEHMFSLYGNWCQGKWILSLAWYSHQSCPVHSAGGQGFMSWVNCTLRSERRKIILCMFFLLLRCELGRAFSSNNICFHAFFHAFTVACGRTSE